MMTTMKMIVMKVKIIEVMIKLMMLFDDDSNDAGGYAGYYGSDEEHIHHDDKNVYHQIVLNEKHHVR